MKWLWEKQHIQSDGTIYVVIPMYDIIVRCDRNYIYTNDTIVNASKRKITIYVYTLMHSRSCLKGSVLLEYFYMKHTGIDSWLFFATVLGHSL